MKDVIVRVPQLIEATLEEDDLLLNDLDDVFAITPNSQASVQEWARRVISLWNRVNAVRSDMTPPLPPLLLGPLESRSCRRDWETIPHCCIRWRMRSQN